MKKLFLLATCGILAGFLRAEAFDASGFDKLLEMNVPAGSAPDGVVLTDFPALVRLSSSIEGFSYSDFRQGNGEDLAFLDASGNLLVHEIDTWNEDGESLVWVKIPRFMRGAKIYMVYGNSSYSGGASPTGVWNGFAGVWHMREASGVVADAAGNGLSATPSGARADSNVGIADGVVGMARKNGGNGGNGAQDRAYLSIPAYDSLALGDTFTVSGFFRVEGNGGWYRLFSRVGAGGGWGQELLWSNAETVYVYGAGGPTPTVSVPGLVGNWVHLAFSYNASECKVYANGTLLQTLAINPATDNGLPLSIGCTSAGDDWSLCGDYDEVRLCGGNLDAERIAADYATATQLGFFVYGAVEECNLAFVDPSAYAKFVRISASPSALPSDGRVNRFPVLVRLSEKIDGFRYADFMDNGADLVFAEEGGRLLACEIDTWNTAGESLVWVKVPAFGNDTDLCAYWGGGEAYSVASTETWSDFAGVWHMNRSGAESEPDVSGHGLDAKPWDTARTEEMVAVPNGVAGSARINQTSGDVRNCLSVPSYPAIGDTFTVSGWFNASSKDGWHRLLSRKTQYGTDGWEIEMYSGADKIDVYGSGTRLVCADVSDLQGSWNHLAFVYSGTSVCVYQNGVQIASGGITAVEDLEDRPFGIGNNAVCGERSFVGSYDEVRLMRGALDAARIAADCATVTNAAFLSYGSVGAPAADAPVFSAPVLSKDGNGEMLVTVAMSSGVCIPKIRFTSVAGNTDVALEDAYVSGAHSWTVAVPPSLATGLTYTFSAVGINSRGGEVSVSGTGCFYMGQLEVCKFSDAAEDGLVAGGFTVSRADAHGDLAVNYARGGTASAGVDYAGAAFGTVTIPAGSTSAQVVVTPKVNASLDADTSVGFAFADGFYFASGSTASMTIENLAPAKKRDFKKCIAFSFPMEFLEEGEALADFPALIRLSEAIPGFSYGTFKIAGGGDMMFTDASGRTIPSEVVTWDEAGVSLVWVSVPELRKGTVVKMYYGNGTNPAGIEVAKWPAYAGVWHLEEAGATAFDSSENSFDAVAMRNARSRAEDLTAVADGAVGCARVNQDGTTFYDVGTYDADILSTARRNYLSVPKGVDHGLGGRFSFSGWFRTTGGTEWSETLACKRISGYNYGWKILRKPTVDGKDTSIEIKVADGGNVFTVPDMRSGWVHLLVSMDRAETGDAENPYKSVASVYANGEFVGSTAGSTRMRDNDYPLTFGNIDSLTDDYAFYGQYDELRLKSGTSSAAWAKAEYLTVADPSFARASGAVSAAGGFMMIVR